MANFNPEEHLINLRGGQYLEVKWRLVWFREENPHGKVDTEIVMTDPIVVKATIYNEEGVSLSTGMGTPKTQGAAKNRPFEGAETAAIGRALAHAGYGTQFTGEDEGEHLADAPVERKKMSKAASPETLRPLDAPTLKKMLVRKAEKKNEKGVTASDKQRKALPGFMSLVYPEDVDRHAVMHHVYGVDTTQDLNDGQVLALLDWLSPKKTDGVWGVTGDVNKEASALFGAVLSEQGQEGFDL
jgi:hypothetical protein